MFKRIIKSDAVRNFACWLAALYIRLVWRTSRWRVVNGQVPQRFWDEGKPVVAALWHSRLLMMPKSWPVRAPVVMLISRHRDGELIANTIARFGFGAIRGSSRKPGKDKDKGGQAAMMAMARAARAGSSIGITPDGPRGPRMRASAGIAVVARMTGLPVLCVASGTKRRITLGTWDRFMLPLPFTRGVFVWGEPIAIARAADEAEMEIGRQAIEDMLMRVTNEADRQTGHTPTEPEQVSQGAS